MRWFGVVLIGLTAFSNSALPAPAHRPAQTPPVQPAPDQGAETRIAAVVNDEVVSVADVRSRLRMVMLSSNFPDSPETRQRIAGQVLRTIVDEKLQMQEAKRQNVTATDDEINKAIKALPAKDGRTISLSQAAGHLYNVKVAWRNPTMHPKITHTLEEVADLISTVKAFMNELAQVI